MYARNGAFLTREEKLKGMKVDMTMVGGKVLYERV
jgi:hypothetical protein